MDVEQGLMFLAASEALGRERERLAKAASERQEARGKRQADGTMTQTISGGPEVLYQMMGRK